MTHTQDHAIALKNIAENEDWGGMARTVEDAEELGRALGAGPEGRGLLVVWWD